MHELKPRIVFDMKTGVCYKEPLTAEEVEERLNRARLSSIEKQQTIERETRRRKAFEQLKRLKEKEDLDIKELVDTLSDAFQV